MCLTARKQEFKAKLLKLIESTAFEQDSNRRNKNEEILRKSFYSKPHCLPKLIEIGTSDSSEITIFARIYALMAANRIVHMWNKIPNTKAKELKQVMLSRIFTETSHLARKHLMDFLAAIWHMDFKNSSWDELISQIVQGNQEKTVKREIWASLSFSMAQDMISMKCLRYHDFFSTIFKYLVDADSFEIRYIGLQIIGLLPNEMKEDKFIFGQIEEYFDQMLSVLQEIVNSGDLKRANIGFLIFEGFFLLKSTLNSNNLEALVAFLLDTFCNKKIEAFIRVLAGKLFTLVPSRQFINEKNLHSILFRVADILVEPWPQEAINPSTFPADDENSNDTPLSIARKIIYDFSYHVLISHVFSCMNQKIMEFDQSLDPHARRAACTCIAMIAQGCAVQIAPVFNDYISLVLQRMYDSDAEIRKEACIALCFLSKNFDNEIKAHHKEIMCILTKLLQDTDISVVNGAVDALAAVFEKFEENAVLYLPSLMQILDDLMKIDNLKLKQSVVETLKIVAEAAKGDLRPYFPSLLQKIMQMIEIKCNDSEEITLKCTLIEYLASIFEAIGIDAARPHFKSISEHVMKNIYSFPGVNRCYYVLLEALAKIFKVEFTPLLPALITRLLQSIQTESRQHSDVELKFEEIIQIEQAQAIHLIAALAEIMGEHFVAYIEAFVGPIIPFCYNNFAELKVTAVSSLLRIVAALYQVKYPNQKFVPGLPLNQPLDKNIRSKIRQVMDVVIQAFDNEYDVNVIARILSSINDSIKICGPALVSESRHLEKLTDYLQEMFKVMYFSYEKVSVSSRDQVTLLSSLCEFSGSLAAAIGPKFECRGVISSLLTFMNHRARGVERVIVLECVAELCNALKDEITPWTESFMKILNFKVENDDERLCSAYVLGMLVANSTENFQLENLFESVLPLINMEKMVSESACGAISRIQLRAIGESKFINLKTSLEILLNAMPLKIQLDENSVCFEFLCRMLKSDTIFISQQHVEKIMEIFKFAFTEGYEESKQRILKCINNVIEGSFDPQVKQCCKDFKINLL